MNTISIFTYLLLLVIPLYSAAIVEELQPGFRIDYIPDNIGKNEFRIYCYKGQPKYIINIWRTILLELDIKSDSYVQYDGSTSDEVHNKYLEHQSSWSISFFSWKKKEIKLNPFNQSCVGIESNTKYSIYLRVIRVDYWKILLLLSGILLFVSAPKLSNNSIFYYICGISFGVCASFLILVYFASKVFPKRPMMYGFIIGGWTVGVYMFQMLWDNMQMIMFNYQAFVLYYVLATSLVSFIVCYRLGPVTNQRSKNLIKWALQLTSMVLIYLSSQFQEAAMGCIIILLLIYNCPQIWIVKSRTYWKKRFPPKVKLITNDEYYQQGVQETCKALEELRQYCSSPDCNQWKTVLRIKDAKRFASFVEGDSHLSDDEILEYENTSLNRRRSNLTDEEEEMTDDSSNSNF